MFRPAGARSAESASFGSSPLVRGTHAPQFLTAGFGRFIPACAGNASPEPAAPIARPVLPRVCGERCQQVCQRFCDVGSSPRVRGTPNVRVRVSVERRFIPACAGNAGSARAAEQLPAVHPRVCGERERARSESRRDLGSSPRVRGTRDDLRRGERQIRFIPACAGNASPPAGAKVSAPVHPRVCGERPTTSTAICASFGSSPRVRGTLPRVYHGRTVQRFIPACAGNAFRFRRRAASRSVHPRVCGERVSSLISVKKNGGSSPRVRGTRRISTRSRSGSRFIPACAGNALRPSSRIAVPCGSSPRVRGTHLRYRDPRSRARFIPACAGNAP